METFLIIVILGLLGISAWAVGAALVLWRGKKDAEEKTEKCRVECESRGHEIAKLNAKLENAEENQAFIKEMEKTMGDKFKALSQDVLDEKSQKFSEESDKLLKPVREDLKNLQNKIQDIHTRDVRDRSALTQQIDDLQKNAQQYGKSADNLALALRGNSKTQGDWGEIQLETLLQNSGLRNGEEYEAQPTTRGENGEMLRPDFKINLPDNKHLIVDSKVSLRAYSDFFHAESVEDKKAAIARHVKAVKEHVNGLSSKHYSAARGINAPDFVFMFMTLEPALIEALNSEPGLFAHAYEKNIILCAPTTLMATMRTVERIWRVERQNKNSEEIAKQSGKVYNKLVKFFTVMEKVGTNLDRAQKTYREADSELREAGNLAQQVEQLKTLGASTNKRLPDSYAGISADNVENDSDSENVNHLPPPA